VNDSLIDQWIEEGVRETDPILREQIYYNLQARFIEELFPLALTTSPMHLTIYVSNLKGLKQDPFKLVLKDVYFD
jgi:ABC-type transport system substrate-binding protein